MRWEVLEDNDYGIKLVSPKQNNSEFDYWLVIELVDMIEATGEDDGLGRYAVQVASVSPSEAGKDNLDKA